MPFRLKPGLSSIEKSGHAAEITRNVSRVIFMIDTVYLTRIFTPKNDWKQLSLTSVFSFSYSSQNCLMLRVRSEAKES